MNDDINLTLKTSANTKKKANAFFIYSLGFLLIVFIIASALVFYTIVIGSNFSVLSNTATDLRNKISALSAQKARLLAINERLSTIDKVIASRKKVDERAGAVLALIPDDFSVETFSAGDKLVTIAVSSPNLSDFDSLLEAKLPQYAKNPSIGLTKIDMKSFTQDKSGYSLSLSFYFQK